MKVPARTQFQFSPHISHQEKVVFTKHLATMIKAGIPLSEAIDTLQEQTTFKGFQRILTSISQDIKNGQQLATALQKFPKIFDQFYMSLIQIGEKSGTLQENLDFLSAQLAKDYATRKKVQGALLYPGLVLFATTIMGGFISFFILPQLVDFFSAFEIDLPLSTRILLFFANTMKSYGVLIFLSIGVSLFLFSLFIKLPKIKPVWHAFLLRIPFIGSIIRYSQLTRFARNLGVMIKSGVPISESLETTAYTLSNLVYQQDLLSISEKLKGGKSIGEAMGKAHFFEYPSLVSRMIAVGEKTGKLDETLLYLAEFFEDEIDSVSKSLTTILEPMLLLGIGLVVGFVALAIITPIYELTSGIYR